MTLDEFLKTTTVDQFLVDMAAAMFGVVIIMLILLVFIWGLNKIIEKF